MRPALLLLLPALYSAESAAVPDGLEELSLDACDSAWSGEAECVITDMYKISEPGVVNMEGKILRFGDGGGIEVQGVQATVTGDSFTMQTGSLFTGTTPTSRLALVSDTYIDSQGTYNFSTPEGGGSIWMSAATMLGLSGETIEANGTSSEANGGTIDLWAGERLTVQADTTATSGTNGHGGTLVLSSEGDTQLNGSVKLAGGIRGGQLIISGQTGVYVGMDLEGDPTEVVSIELDSIDAGDGGLLWLSSPSNVGLNANADLSGSGSSSDSGSGGNVVVAHATNVLLAGGIVATGAGPNSMGGTVWMNLTSALIIEGDIDLSATGSHSTGGVLDILSGNGVIISGDFVSEGEALGGNVKVAAGTDIGLYGAMNVNGNLDAGSGRGGHLDLAALTGALTVTGPLSISGRAGAGGAGSVDLLGCTTETAFGGRIEASGTGAEVLLTGIDSLTLGAGIVATGGEIILRTLDSTPVYDGSVSFEPPPLLVNDPTLMHCCVPATCENPFDLDGDGYANSFARGADCDDSDPTVHPSAVEDPVDGVDNDCDGLVDETDESGDPDGDDTGVPSGDGDGDDTGSSATEPDPADPDTGGEGKGCSCGAGASPAGLWLMIGIIPLIRRR